MMYARYSAIAAPPHNNVCGWSQVLKYRRLNVGTFSRSEIRRRSGDLKSSVEDGKTFTCERFEIIELLTIVISPLLSIPLIQSSR